ncbi:hypothetical protein [Bacillus thermotolerans]|uniref:Histidine kinase n=1 Tax=Bacillus thermotolerans TaxID=1221996 RepID=A0A0F5I7G7_BACTR|nr:hypothetical protein [Bacillus thermotolerans]KKB41225.1 hypothetical protein QY95_00932 [Bacillus thermotolerans]KKB44089.1 hypothetical protein QY96_03715 [Bacillus thermotolerans]
MKKLTFVIPVMILVGSLSLWMLGKDYSEIALQTRLLITAGAMIFSGIISYFLLGSDGEKFNDSLAKKKREK